MVSSHPGRCSEAGQANFREIPYDTGYCTFHHTQGSLVWLHTSHMKASAVDIYVCPLFMFKAGKCLVIPSWCKHARTGGLRSCGQMAAVSSSGRRGHGLCSAETAGEIDCSETLPFRFSFCCLCSASQSDALQTPATWSFSVYV